MSRNVRITSSTVVKWETAQPKDEIQYKYRTDTWKGYVLMVVLTAIAALPFIYMYTH